MESRASEARPDRRQGQFRSSDGASAGATDSLMVGLHRRVSGPTLLWLLVYITYGSVPMRTYGSVPLLAFFMSTPIWL